jgi:hypothetical protein
VDAAIATIKEFMTQYENLRTAAAQMTAQPKI